MPGFTRVQLILLELAAGAIAGGFALHRGWRWVGVGVAVALVALSVVPIMRRWAYQLVLSYVSMMRRRRAVRGPGLQSLLGGYRVVTVPPGRQGTAFGAVRVGATWTVPLELSLDHIYDDDADIPVDELATLLRVEGVPLSTVRLITLLSPARASPGAPAMPVSSPPRRASRYCLLTLDLSAAPVAIAERGGSDAAVAQILRRCALRAEEVFSANGITVRRLDEARVAALFPTLMGPAAPQQGGSLPPTVETWRDIRVAGTWSTTFAVAGAGSDVNDRLAQFAGRVPMPVAVTSLVLRPSRRAQLRITLLLRISGPGMVPDRTAVREVQRQAREQGLVLQRLDGEQGSALRSTTPVGMATSR